MDKQDQDFNRLLKKLSALRATLKGNERNLLDGLIMGPIDEVGAHAMNVTPIISARNAGKATSADEAKANAMHVSTARNAGKAMSADEAKANAMHVSTARNTGKAVSADETRANAMSVKIIYNPAKDEYQRAQ